MTRADGYESLPVDAAARWARYGRSETVYYPMLLGLEIEEARIDYCRMRLPFRSELLQPGGAVHGGAIASLLDAVLVPAVGALLGRNDRFSTVDLHVQYLGAVTNDDVVAEGWVTKRGRNIVFCQSEAVAASDGRLIAKSLATYNVSLADLRHSGNG